MNRLIFFLVLLIPALANAQTSPFIRNDNASSTVQSNNLGASKGSTTNKGELFIKKIADPVTIAVSSPIAVTVATPINVNNVSGTVSLPTGASTLAKQDEIIAAIASIAPGGNGGAIEDGVTPSIKATVKDYTNSNPLTVTLSDTNGDYVSVGGGTQYSDGDNEPDPIGNVVMWKDGSDDILAASTSNPLPVGVISSLPAGNNNIGDVDIASGTVTCNAGTNLNTSTLATSANQTTELGYLDGIETLLGTGNTNTGNIVTSVQLIDDAIATTASAITTKGMVASGTDGTNARVLKTDTSGELQTDVLTLPSVTIGTFPDNEPFNVAQINGVTPLMGAGNTGTGSPRVTIATDQGAEATWETAVAYLHSSITASYTTAMTSSNPKRLIKFNNKTNGDLYISFDASTNHIYLDIGESLIMDLATNNRYESSNISVKYVTDPTSGSLYITAAY